MPRATRLMVLVACVLSGGFLAISADAADPPVPRVDFAYAFATPHRITVGRPDSSERTLLDLQPHSLRMAWSNDNLSSYPFATFKTPPTQWDIRITPQLDGAALAGSRWTRLDAALPALVNMHESQTATVKLTVVGTATAVATRLELSNRDSKPHAVVLRIDSASWGENPAWVDPARWSGDNIVAGWNERADRILVVGIGADAFSLQPDGRAPGPRSMAMVWNLAAGATRHGWLVRPHHAYTADLPALRSRDWSIDVEKARREWLTLLDRASLLKIPDTGVAEAFRACLADLFIMREPVEGGAIAGVPGTEAYRAANSFEAGIVAVALDQLGLHTEAATGYRAPLELQEPDGNWNDAKGWGHLMWGGAGFKSWTAMEHYRLTGDRTFLAWVYPRMLASSRWQERERARSRVPASGARSLIFGLMPRGMGDCGLMDESDLYGIFLPHNIWAVCADKLTLEAAEILGKTSDIDELKRIYETGRADLLTALDRGAIKEADYRWIPGVPAKTSGSRWGALNALYPCGLLPPRHELIEGTLRKIESNMSPGGIPIHTGWLADGMWVAITLDNVAEAHLVRHEGDVAARYLYATLNHATPLVTWCEERGPEPGTSKCTGDRQHLWTPVAVVRSVRDFFVMEEGDTLQLALGLPRHWVGGGDVVGVDQAPTHFGPLSYRMHFDRARSLLEGSLSPPAAGLGFRVCSRVVLNARLPKGLKLKSVDIDSGATVSAEGESLEWSNPQRARTFKAVVGR